MRTSLKIVGASGQGIDSIGEVLAKALKRAGFCVFGYREYPSLIKGGHASYQLDFDSEYVGSTETNVNIVISLNHHGLEHNIPDLKPGGIFIHSTDHWKFPAEHQKLIKDRGLVVVNMPIEAMLAKLKAKPILSNVILSAFVWAILEQDIDSLKKMVGEKFAKKKDLLELNMQSIDAGYAYQDETLGKLRVAAPKPNKKWKDHLLLTGSKAMGLGAAHAGVRLYAGYPMTPSSPLLTYIAGIQNETGMVIKQAEDEITAAQIVSGAMFMGTRALTATSGGGFDLMSETLSMNAIIENPSVFVLAMRPGPATGLPTWTGQGDLLMAVNTAHGEFTRCVMSVSESDDAFHLMPEAFNIAEEYQISVIVLTDKQIAEALYTQAPYDMKRAVIKRGKLVTDAKKLAKLKGSDRYDPTVADGVSQRWLPGAKAETYCAQGDEHSGDGTVDESAHNAIAQIDKRLRKADALLKALPDAELFGDQSPETLIVGWGSTKTVMLDALLSDQLKDKKIGYLHYTYLWPLKTGKFEALHKTAKRVILAEGTKMGQLAMMLRMQTGINIEKQILKYDGRPFFYDELVESISKLLKK
ncbi:MAG TPA: 2-oxoacid:acceptor oxidoreductase subunit alpha [Candidatus Peribacteria bacterium]|nr:2-oxoacid:acceptor oxidoreductase subunit alpha [Candidatus Peribacteria bacterium]